MIEARGLTKRYGDTLAVDDLSLQVRPGVVTGFLGPNGAGKSTTMRMILGLDRPTPGTALVSGRPTQPARARCARSARCSTPRTCTAGGGPGTTCWPGAEQRHPGRRVDEVLEMAGMQTVAGKRIKGFSLGMWQRLGHRGRAARRPES